MTLESAIKHCEEVIDEKSYEYQDCIEAHYMEDAMACVKCADEHRQLAGWLKELKKFRSLKCASCNEYNCEENWCYKHGIDMAYDDFCSEWEN